MSPDPQTAQAQPDLASPLAVAAQRDRSMPDTVRRAIARQDVLLAFQPVMSVHSPEQPAFYEGLVRIMDETGRLIPAGDFIGTIEIDELGRRIDCLALEMGLISLGRDPKLRIAINMSARSIGYPAWLRMLEDGLRADPTAGERLILEITESSAMAMPDVVSAFMADVRGRGVCFALDDFGAAQTSLRHLRDFFFDILKIDGQFIGGIAASRDNQVLVQALVSVARHFEMFTVAEAVETAADAAFLAGIGIDGIQGYYFGAASILPPWERAARDRHAARAG